MNAEHHAWYVLWFLPEMLYSFRAPRYSRLANFEASYAHNNTLHFLLVGVAGHAHQHWGSDYSRNAIFGQIIAICLMVTAIFMTVYSSFFFAYRASLLKYARALHTQTSENCFLHLELTQIVWHLFLKMQIRASSGCWLGHGDIKNATAAVTNLFGDLTTSIRQELPKEWLNFLQHNALTKKLPEICVRLITNMYLLCRQQHDTITIASDCFTT